MNCANIPRLIRSTAIASAVAVIALACDPDHATTHDTSPAERVAEQAGEQAAGTVAAGRTALPEAVVLPTGIPGISELTPPTPDTVVPPPPDPAPAAPTSDPPVVPPPPDPAPAAPTSDPPVDRPPPTSATEPDAPPVAPDLPPSTAGPPEPAPPPPPADPEPHTCVAYRIDDVLFNSAAAELAPGAEDSLAAVAALIADDARVSVIGHTDSLPSAIGNQRLSELRAQTVAEALIGAGLNPESVTEIAGRGETEPIADNGTDEGRRLNRRVEVYINCAARQHRSAASEAGRGSAAANPTTPADPTTDDPEAVPAGPRSEPEADMLGMVGEFRADLELQPLLHHQQLASVARAWSATMDTTGRLEHNPDYTNQYPTGWLSAAENIAFVTVPTTSPESLAEATMIAFQGLVNSPPHYKNLTNPTFTHIGIGIHLSTDTLWVTQNFAHYPPE
ncbi:MAG: OmpA family protein [bacterium]|nr:OmpA family protein [bacterium]